MPAGLVIGLPYLCLATPAAWPRLDLVFDHATHVALPMLLITDMGR